MKMRLFEKSVIVLIAGAVILSLVILWAAASRQEINPDEYPSQVVNLAGVRG